MSGVNLSTLAVRQPALTLFAIIAILVAGLLAYLNLGRAEDPGFTVKVVTVSAVWPGATPREMQDLVAEPLEKRLLELDHVDHVDTFTRPGLAFISLSLKDDIPASRVPELFYQARKKLADQASRLPAGVIGPFVDDEYSDLNFALYALKAKGAAPRMLVRQAEILRERFGHVPGVLKVNITGEQAERIYVRFDPKRLATSGLGARDVFGALQSQNLVAPAGMIQTHGPEVSVRLDHGYDDVQAVRDTPIVANGRSLTLGQIATVDRGYEDPPDFLIRNGGEPALILGVVSQKGWNGLQLGRALAQEEAGIIHDLPLGFTFSKVSDQARNIREAVGEFMFKFVLALLVVMFVSLVALGLRGALVVATAVPLTLAAVFVVMALTGRQFDRITLGALILSLGLLVDDAIIAVEMMVVQMQNGLPREEAAGVAWTVTAAPMLTGTLVTVIGLMPIGFARSSAGEYAANIFWVVGFALLSSWAVAVVFTPYLGVRLLGPVRRVDGGHDAIYATPTYRRLRGVVVWCVDRRGLVSAAAIGALLLGAAGMALVRDQFFPVSERPELIAEVYRPPGSAIATTSASVAKLECWLRDRPEAKVVTSYVGQGPPRFFLALDPELPDPSFGKIVILTPDAAARDRLKIALRAAVAKGLVPDARVRLTQLLFGPPIPYPVAFRVIGPDPARLRSIAASVSDVLRAHPAMRDVNVDWGEKRPGVRVALDQARLRGLGLTPKDAADQLQFLLSGAPITQIREDVRTVEVAARADSVSPAELGSATLATSAGRAVALSQVGDLQIVEDDSILKRRDREPVMTVRGDIDDQRQPADVTAQLLTRLANVRAHLPGGYRIETGGSVEEAEKADVAIAKVVPAMLLLLLAVVMIQVRSFRGLALVVLTAPLGLIGAAPALLLFNQPFGFLAILGLIGLAGILMRNSLIFIGQIDANRRAGLAPRAAVVEATVRRARPVLLTAAAAALAFIPLAFSPFWGPMAVTLIGGVAMGTGVTLVVFPALYALLFRVPRSRASVLDCAPSAPA